MSTFNAAPSDLPLNSDVEETPLQAVADVLQEDGTVVFSEDEARRLAHKVDALMWRWSPSPNQSDYECAFCEHRAPNNHTEVNHTADCYGKELLHKLLPGFTRGNR